MEGEVSGHNLYNEQSYLWGFSRVCWTFHYFADVIVYHDALWFYDHGILDHDDFMFDDDVILYHDAFLFYDDTMDLHDLMLYDDAILCYNDLMFYDVAISLLCQCNALWLNGNGVS